MIFRYAVLITVTLNAALNTAVAFENVPDVSKGAQQFHEIYRIRRPSTIGHSDPRMLGDI